MHGRFKVAGTHKPVLFAFLDDHSTLVPGRKWKLAEDTLRAGNRVDDRPRRRRVRRLALI